MSASKLAESTRPAHLAAKLNQLKLLLGHPSLHLLHPLRHHHENPIVDGLGPILPLLDVLNRMLQDRLELLYLPDESIGQIPIGPNVFHQAPHVTVNVLRQLIIVDLLLQDLFVQQVVLV